MCPRDGTEHGGVFSDMLYYLLLHPNYDHRTTLMRQKAFDLIKAHLKYILIALLCTLILVFFIRYDQISLSTDDDVQLNLIASGALGPHSQYLIYMNIVYGWFLKLLYLAVPSVNWYLFCSLFSNLLAIISVCWLFSRRLPVLPALSVTILCMLFFSKDFLLSTQFSTNVFILAAAGYFWLLYAIKQEKRLAILPATFFLVLSAFWRTAAFLMTVPFFFTALCVHFAAERDAWKDKNLFKKLALPLLPFVLIAILIGLDQYAYAKDEDWSYFTERVEALVELQDRGFVDYLNHADLYDAAGIPMETVNLVTNWLDNDPEVYSLEQLQKMGEIKRSYNPISFRFDIRVVVETAKSVSDRLLSGRYLLPWACVAGGLIFAFRKDKKHLWMLLLYALLIYAVYYALNCYGRLGWHVETGIWLLVFLLPFEDLFTEHRPEPVHAVYEKSEKRLHIATAVLLSAFILLCGIDVARYPQGKKLVPPPNTALNAERSHEVLEYVCAHKENFYMATSPLSWGYWGAASVYDLNYANRDHYENICWLGGWFAGSPIGNYHALEAGISNPMRALLERPNTFLVATETEAERIYYFLAANYRDDITYRRTYATDEYGIWQFSVL